MANFNTDMGQVTEMSQRKKTDIMMCTLSFCSSFLA